MWFIFFKYCHFKFWLILIWFSKNFGWIGPNYTDPKHLTMDFLGLQRKHRSPHDDEVQTAAVHSFASLARSQSRGTYTTVHITGTVHSTNAAVHRFASLALSQCRGMYTTIHSTVHSTTKRLPYIVSLPSYGANIEVCTLLYKVHSTNGCRA